MKGSAGFSYLFILSYPGLHSRAPPFHPLPPLVVPLEPLVQTLDGSWMLLVVVPGGSWSCCGLLSCLSRTPGALLVEAAESRGTAARGAGGRSARMALEVGRSRKLLLVAPGEVWNCRRSVNSPLMFLGGVGVVYPVATTRLGKALMTLTTHSR